MKWPAPLARAEPARENEQARVQDRPVPFLPEKSKCWLCFRQRMVKFATELEAATTNHLSTLPAKANWALPSHYCHSR